MHGQNGDSDVHGFHGQEGGGDGSQGCPAFYVGAVGKFFVRNMAAAADILNDTDAGGIGGVGLGGSHFDGNAVAWVELVFDVAFFRVIGVHGMGHVHGQKESVQDRV